MTKYELTQEKSNLYGKTLFRIRALIDIPEYGVKAGDLGGFVSSVRNLSQKGSAWIADNAHVFGDACVQDDALVAEKAEVFNSAIVANKAQVRDCAQVIEVAQILDYAQIMCKAMVRSRARVYERGEVAGGAAVSGNARILGCARVEDAATVSGYAKVGGGAYVGGLAIVDGNTTLGDAAYVVAQYDYTAFNLIGSRDGTTTFVRQKQGGIWVRCGCYSGTINEFEDRVRKTHGDNAHAKAYLAAIEYARTVVNAAPAQRVKAEVG